MGRKPGVRCAGLANKLAGFAPVALIVRVHVRDSFRGIAGCQPFVDVFHIGALGGGSEVRALRIAASAACARLTRQHCAVPSARLREARDGDPGSRRRLSHGRGRAATAIETVAAVAARGLGGYFTTHWRMCLLRLYLLRRLQPRYARRFAVRRPLCAVLCGGRGRQKGAARAVRRCRHRRLSEPRVDPGDLQNLPRVRHGGRKEPRLQSHHLSQLPLRVLLFM